MGLFSVFNLFGGGGTHFQYLSLFFEKGSVCLQKILKYILGINYSRNHAKSNMVFCLRFAMLFKGILGPIFAHYTVPLVSRNPKYYLDVLHRFSGH